MLLVAFFLVTFLPLRYFILIAGKHFTNFNKIVLRKFKRGKTYYKRRFVGNMEACKIEIRNFLSDNNYLKG